LVRFWRETFYQWRAIFYASDGYYYLFCLVLFFSFFLFLEIIINKLRAQHGVGCEINWFYDGNAIETRLQQFDNSNTNHKSKKWKEKSGGAQLPGASFRNDDQVKAIR